MTLYEVYNRPYNQSYFFGKIGKKNLKQAHFFYNLYQEVISKFNLSRNIDCVAFSIWALNIGFSFSLSDSKT